MDERIFQFNLSGEVGRYFDDSSLSNGEQPKIVILTGGPGAGKTTVRKQSLSQGYVLVDAAEIFVRLSRGECFPFPGPLEEPMNIVGNLVAQRAISERRHIVTELIGADHRTLMELIQTMTTAGYKIEVRYIHCGIEAAVSRNLSRGDDNISSYYAEPYQRRWLIEAAQSALNSQPPRDA